jgi:hypothetical protein
MKMKIMISHLLSTSRSLLIPQAGENKLKSGSHAIHELFLGGIKKHRRLYAAAPSAKTLVLAKTINTHKLIR